MLAGAFLLIAFITATTHGQSSTSYPPSWPHDYPGKPSGDFSPAWQDYFQVTDTLPNVTFGLGRNWAGNINVKGAGANDTLFFWAFEKEDGSLTAKAGQNQDAPWAIFLDGANVIGESGISSLLFSNGPMFINSELGISPSNSSWSKLADFFWLDYPVSVGYSTASEDGYAKDADHAGEHFWGFVDNLVKVFPSLATRPLYLIAQYSGTQLTPYIAKSYFSRTNAPTKLAKIVMADPILGGVEIDASVINIIQTYPQLIGYDPAVYSYFAEQAHLCGFDLNLTYPQRGGKLPDLRIMYEWVGSIPEKRATYIEDAITRARSSQHQILKAELHSAWKRDLADRANGTLDPWYQCNLWYELIDYAANFSVPWHVDNWESFFIIPRESNYLWPQNLHVYEASSAINPYTPWNASIFMNDDRTRASLHAPSSKDWSEFTWFSIGPGIGDPTGRLASFFDDLAANATKNDVSIVIYSGNENIWFSHWVVEAAIQNTTFSGIQGFSRKPSTPWFNDDGSLGGIVHQERNWTYGLIYSGLVGGDGAYPFLREFVFGTNTTGLVTSAESAAQGGEDARLNASALPAPHEIYLGSASTTSTYVAPSASIAAWESFAASAAGITPTAVGGGSGRNGAMGVGIANSLVGLGLTFFGLIATL